MGRSRVALRDLGVAFQEGVGVGGWSMGLGWNVEGTGRGRGRGRGRVGTDGGDEDVNDTFDAWSVWIRDEGVKFVHHMQEDVLCQSSGRCRGGWKAKSG